MVVGVLNDPLAPSSFKAWISYAGSSHVGAISFFLMDFFLFFGVAVLTVVQASQVSHYPFSESLVNLHMLMILSSFLSSFFFSFHLSK